VFSLILAGVIGYFIGSVPTAYLVVRWKSKVDIRQAGSGNVGTLNSFQVTKSKLVGVAVLVIDLMKGAMAVVLARALIGADFSFAAFAGIGSVIGHNFPVWLRFKGGRGLATAAGVMLVLAWIVVALWGLFWGVGFLASRKVNIGNAVASLLTLLFGVIAPASTLHSIFTAEADTMQYRYFMAVLLAFILLKHVGPVREYVREKIRGTHNPGDR